jgi:hypothetical protein
MAVSRILRKGTIGFLLPDGVCLEIQQASGDWIGRGLRSGRGPPDGVKKSLFTRRDGGGKGGNVAAPFKIEAFEAATRCMPRRICQRGERPDVRGQRDHRREL